MTKKSRKASSSRKPRTFARALAAAERRKPTKALVELMRLGSKPKGLAEQFNQMSPGTDWIKAGKPYLPTDATERKALPIVSGVLDYFPLALLEVARVSVAGNAQHNPGEPLHWARGKSTDQADTTVRHIMERGGKDTDGQYHLAKAIWRLCADLQIEIEQERGLPPSRGAWLPEGTSGYGSNS